MYFKSICSVLLHIFLRICVTREFARLTYRNETGAQSVGQCCTQDESTGLKTRHLGDALVLIKFINGIYSFPEGICIVEQCRDIPEEDAFFREIRNRPDTGNQKFLVHQIRM